VSASITSATGTAGASLLGTATVQANAGVVTFTDLAIDLAGTGYTLTFNSGVLTPVVSGTFDITGGAGVGLRIATQPGGAAMASPFVDQPEIEIVDAGGNVDTTDNTTMVSAAITASSGTSGAALGGTTSVQAVNGVVTFSGLSIDLAGNGYRLDFSATGFMTEVSDPFNVAGAAADLAIGQHPGRAVFNTPFLDQPAVEIHDAGGNLVTSDNSTVVTATLVAGTGALGGTLTATAVNGVATLTNLQIDTAGLGFEIEFTSAPALTPARSAPFDVAGVATQLGIRAQPSDARAGQVFGQQPVIEVQDANGVLVATDNTTQVAVALGAGGPSGATLGGTLTVTVADGVATFTDLEIDMPGTDYTLDFSDTAATLTGVTSDPFRVRRGPFFPPGCTAGADGAYAALFAAMGVLALGGLRRRRRV
jgi:MYXO-CTERM domain-containing protein